MPPAPFLSYTRSPFFFPLQMERAFDDMHGEAEDARDTLEDLLENRATAYKQLLQAAAVRAPPAVGSHGRGDSVPEVNMARENSKGRRSDSASSRCAWCMGSLLMYWYHYTSEIRVSTPLHTTHTVPAAHARAQVLHSAPLAGSSLVPC